MKFKISTKKTQKRIIKNNTEIYFKFFQFLFLVTRQASINSSINVHNNQDLTVKYSNAQLLGQTNSRTTFNKIQKKIAPVIIATFFFYFSPFLSDFLPTELNLTSFLFVCWHLKELPSFTPNPNTITLHLLVNFCTYELRTKLTM
jgi:hypothetical protein